MAGLFDSVKAGFGALARGLFVGAAQALQMDESGETVKVPVITHQGNIQTTVAAHMGNVAFGLLGKAVRAFEDGEAVIASGGLNIALDEAEFSDLKAVVEYLRNHPKSAPMVGAKQGLAGTSAMT